MLTTLPTFLSAETRDRRERLTRSWGRSRRVLRWRAVDQLRGSAPAAPARATTVSCVTCPAVAG